MPLLWILHSLNKGDNYGCYLHDVRLLLENPVYYTAGSHILSVLTVLTHSPESKSNHPEHQQVKGAETTEWL